jgi:FkbM family methyltransferase
MDLEKYAFETFIKQGTVVYDIGAHIGELSILAAQLNAKIIYSFEPSDFNINELINNTSMYKNIFIHKVALNEKSYECDTRFKDCADNRLPISLDTKQHIKYAILEEYIKINQLELPDFIKLDVEGMESIVLKTFEFLFKEKRPIIYTEIHAAQRGNLIQNYKDNPHWKWVEEGGFDFNILKKFNYTILNSTGKINHNIDWNPQENTHSGLLLIPNEYE